MHRASYRISTAAAAVVLRVLLFSPLPTTSYTRTPGWPTRFRHRFTVVIIGTKNRNKRWCPPSVRGNSSRLPSPGGVLPVAIGRGARATETMNDVRYCTRWPRAVPCTPRVGFVRSRSQRENHIIYLFIYFIYFVFSIPPERYARASRSYLASVQKITARRSAHFITAPRIIVIGVTATDHRDREFWDHH